MEKVLQQVVSWLRVGNMIFGLDANDQATNYAVRVGLDEVFDMFNPNTPIGKIPLGYISDGAVKRLPLFF